MLSVGQIAPDFVLPNQDGTPVRLSDQRGKKVIIFAFPAANTAGCTAQACGFRDALPQFENAGAIVFGISADKLPALQKFKRGQKLPYDLLSDENHAVLDAWSAWGKNMLGLFTLPIASRSYWVLDEDGRVMDLQIGVGPGESVEKALKTVRNAAASNR